MLIQASYRISFKDANPTEKVSPVEASGKRVSTREAVSLYGTGKGTAFFLKTRFFGKSARLPREALTGSIQPTGFVR